MILNAAREPVWNAKTGQPSLCPDCGDKLFPRKPEHCVWHWCHYPSEHSRVCTCAGETQWHLRMKFAYLQIPGWQIEMPIEVHGKKYRIDAANQRTGRLREFVHSLSKHYIDKHHTIKSYLTNYSDVLWIFDGTQFASGISVRRTTSIGRRPYIKNLLKPTSQDLYDEVGGLVHYADSLWHEWIKNDLKTGMWFESTGERAQYVLKLYDAVKDKDYL